MMKAAHGTYLITLTYDDSKVDFDPAAYQQQKHSPADRMAILQGYRRKTRKHLNALRASLQRHAGTRLGSGWAGEVTLFPSCLRGAKDIELRRAMSLPVPSCPDRLHIHGIIEGVRASTIGHWIERYWRARHGLTELCRSSDDAHSRWFREYAAAQSLYEIGIPLNIQFRSYGRNYNATGADGPDIRDCGLLR